MEQLGDFAGLIQQTSIHDLETLCLAIARLADGRAGVEHTRNRTGLLTISVDKLALDVIEKLVRAADQAAGTRVASTLASDGSCLSVAAYLLLRSYKVNYEEDPDLFVMASEGEKNSLISAFAENVLRATENGVLLNCARPSGVLWALACLSPDSCQGVFHLAKVRDTSLDGFALALLNGSYDSHKGQAYEVPEHLEHYVSLRVLKEHAQERLQDRTLDFPARAAWLSVETETARYAVDGTEQD
jgi:hypothetical protein